MPVLTRDGAARSNARFARSSTCRDASRAIARLTMSRKLSGSMPRRIFSGSSSPTTTLRATRTGKQLERLIWLREEQGFKFKVTLQVDTLCHRLDGFIEKAARGGCARVFIGLENIDPGCARFRQKAAKQDLGIPQDVRPGRTSA